MKNSSNRNFKIEDLKIWHFLIAALIVYTIPIVIYLLNFYKFSLSKNPGDWASLGDYLGGVAGSLISLINIFAVIWLALKVFDLETKRNERMDGLEDERTEKMYKRETEREESLQALSVKPFCRTYSSDYVNEVKVVVRNYGLGLAKINKIDIADTSCSSAESVIDLVDLMPDDLPEGIFWRDYTINGFSYVPAGGEVNLIWLKGEEDDPIFSGFRDQVREKLSKISVTITYTDIFDKKVHTSSEILDAFSRQY